MDWQQAASLLIVAGTGALFLRGRLRRQKFNLARDTHCGCAGATSTGSHGAIVYHARKGERARILVKFR